MKRVADAVESRSASSTTGATPPNTQRVHVVDSHTAGEPTRVVLDGGPDLGTGSLSQRLQRLRSEHDGFRSAVVNEPRGSDVLIGALLTEPVAPDATIGVIFFNNVGYLGMCGHGTIGVVETLRHLGRIAPGRHRIETPVGTVVAELLEDGRVSLENVPAYRHRAAVTVQVPEHGTVTGDVAYGGNWFFLIGDPLASHTTGNGSKPGVATPPPVDMDHIEELTDFTWAVRDALRAAGVTGADGAEIDHIELYAPSETADSRNFVLCPGKAYDRSPCGTGTSAKLACLHADGVLEAGVVWRQESVIGSSFDASYVLDAEGQVRPTIVGRAHVTAEATLLLAADDPFRWGIR